MIENPFQIASDANEETKDIDELSSMITPIATFKSLKIDSNACLQHFNLPSETTECRMGSVTHQYGL